MPSEERQSNNPDAASQLRESTDRELASLKQEFDDLRQTVSELRAERQQTREQLHQTLRGLGFSGEEIESNVRGLMDHGLTRRAAMLALAGAVGGASFMTGRASAAASTGDSDGDIGTPSNRVDVFADGVDANSVTTESLVTAQGSPGLSFPGSGWQTVDATYDSIVSLKVFASNSASTTAKVVVQVDATGNSAEDYNFQVTPPDTGSAYGSFGNFTVPLPKGGQIQFSNDRDPNGTNTLSEQYYLSTA